jgi:hypothetical protein
MHISWTLWTLILLLNQSMYQTNIVYETTKFTQQSVGSVTSLANLMYGRMSVLALNADPNISVCCIVYLPGPSAHSLSLPSFLSSSSSYSLIPLPIASPVCCPTLSAQLTTCVSLRGTHNFSLPLCKSMCGQGQVLWWSSDCQCGCADSCDAVRRRSPKAT